jgi:phenazine biosynthesis protein phzE
VSDASGLVGRILGPHPPPFAILHRPEETGELVDVLVGTVSTPDTLADVALPDGEDVLVVVPYRQVAERGFACVDDGSPLVAMRVTGHEQVGRVDLLARITDEPDPLSGGHFEPHDDTYA